MPQFEIFYRGDEFARKGFLSSYAETNGVNASNELIATAEQQGSVSQMFLDHSTTSTSSPFVSVTPVEKVGQHFARGMFGDQEGYVTVFKLPKGLAQPNPRNPITWEQEYLVPTEIESRYVVHQYKVPPK